MSARVPIESKIALNGRKAMRDYPEDPARYMAYTVHPLAPFPGNALKWESWVWDDATSYEGLTRVDIPHGKGVMVIGKGYGGGFQDPERGDKYVGEFYGGFAHGLGEYYSPSRNQVYKGQFAFGRRHGCGVLTDLEPMARRVRRGMDPAKAWAECGPDIEKAAMRGAWRQDIFKATADPYKDASYCSVAETKATLAETEQIAIKASMFQYKPDGQVAFEMTQDKNGTPAPLMQDPLHYPHGTGFMMPGPAGQCFALPDEPEIKEAMSVAADNHLHIWRHYNLPRINPPGSFQELAEKWSTERDAIIEARVRELREERDMQLRGTRQPLGREQDRKRVEYDSSDDDAEEEDQRRPPPPQEPRAPPAAPPAADDGGEVDDDDLVAYAEPSASQAAGPGRTGPGTVFGSMTLGAGRLGIRAGGLVQGTLQRMGRRRQLVRPLAMARAD